MSQSEALSRTIEFLATEVKPVAQIIDRDVEALRKVVKRMCELGLMAMKRPVEFGGPDMSEVEFRTYQEEMARASGTLAFLTTQHQSAVSMLSKSGTDLLKAEYLPHMHDGTKLVGIGFSQLRRSGPPLMRATPVDRGYILEGHVPWVTGWTFYPEFLIGAMLPDGQALFAVAPLTAQAGVVISQPMELASLGAAQTVTVDFTEYFLPEDRVAFIRPERWIQKNDLINIALQGHFAMGCAQAGVDIVRAVAEKKGLAFIEQAADALQSELDACRIATRDAQVALNEESTEERLQVRAWAIDLAVRCAHAGVAASSGGSNYLSHPAQRVYREALVFTVSAQTSDVMRVTLDRLVRRAGNFTG